MGCGFWGGGLVQCLSVCMQIIRMQGRTLECTHAFLGCWKAPCIIHACATQSHKWVTSEP